VTSRNFAASDLTRIAGAIFSAAGSQPAEAQMVADHLVQANLAGHDSHGVMRIAKYVDWVLAGEVLANRHATVVTDKGGLLVIDGGFGYGQVIGWEAMGLLGARAKRRGFACAALRNAGHLGRIGAWAEQLAADGLASVHFVNTSGYGILVAPHGGSDRRLSANPIAAGVPMTGGDVILDIATSVIAEGKIQVTRNKGEALPEGLILDGAGKPTTDPARFYAPPPGAILPFGGHKGFGLSFFCEVLAGALTGGGSSHPDNPTAKRLVNNMLSLAFDPAAFGSAEAFATDLVRLADWTKGSPPGEAGGEVLLPGEPERRTRAARLRDGIPLDKETRRQIAAAAKRVGGTLPPEFRE